MAKSKPEEALAFQIRMLRLPKPEREYGFSRTRKWKADFAWPRAVMPLIVEVEGATWVGGRHTRGKGFEADCEKQAEAELAGYRYFRVTPRQIENGKALDWIERALK